MMIHEAREFCIKKHDGQYRLGGEPYSTHPIRVVKILSNLFLPRKDFVNLICAGYCHDLLEDTDVTYEDLVNKFNKKVADLVKEVTNDEARIKEIGKGPHILEKMLVMSDLALTLKLADRLDNTSGFDKAPQRFVEKYKKETQFILNFAAKRMLTVPQQVLFSQIWNNVFP